MLAPNRADPFCAQLPKTVQIYCVGGAVRDGLMGNPISDRDYLVVGATPQDMTRAGFRPVGQDFPIFLHPVSHAEYALARTERKTGAGYKGFVFHTSPGIGLTEDLSRRDLTINAMAIDEVGQLHDPFNGQSDLVQRQLRHVTGAFSEDPVRLLRLARFLAKWPEFTVAQETEKLCKTMVESGEVKALVPERVWQELWRGLHEKDPSAMISFLIQIGAYTPITGKPTPSSAELDLFRNLTGLGDLGAEVLAAWVFGKEGTPPRFALPRDILGWIEVLQRDGHRPHVALPRGQWPEAILNWTESSDLFRKPQRLRPLITLAQALSSDSKYDRNSAIECWAECSEALINWSVSQVASRAAEAGQSIKTAVRHARLEFIRTWLLAKT